MKDTLKYINESDYYVEFYSELLGDLLFSKMGNCWYHGKLGYEEIGVMSEEDGKKINSMYSKYIRSKKLERVLNGNS